MSYKVNVVIETVPVITESTSRSNSQVIFDVRPLGVKQVRDEKYIQMEYINKTLPS